MAETIHRDPDLWLEDGNLVIVASSTTAFRVYRGLLGRVSAVFKDTFEFTAPDPREMVEIDDCPVVRVPDSPVEMGHFLRAVFRPGAFISSQDTLPFATVAAVIRVAHKYQAQEVLAAASDRLESFLIPGPGHWIDSPALSWEDRWTLGQRQCGIAFEAQDAIEAVNLARLVDRPRMLPVALYLCCFVDPVRLRDGVARADGVVEKLSDEDFARCMRALPALAVECHATVSRSLNERGSVSPRLCSDCKKSPGLNVMLHEYLDNVMPGRICPLSDLLVRVDRRSVPVGTGWPWTKFCTACRACWLQVVGEECVKIRKRFDEFFALKDLDA
ncbi:hypothetical protein GSI_09538 [Ganoderma sinense ZZ0214-1]|uniref:BTB domain-containing protein n=1 Tax=Ganoderma sinense ZZ0214-1 TaxID=1077348 RepID=A0A2G8S3T2_9APHY|nr:hypothetical protein GSI_09538 [Ganoderma sinense ZZ0214-1]